MQDDKHPTVRKFPRTLHEAFPGHNDYSNWFEPHKGIKTWVQIVAVALVVAIALLVVTA